MIGPLLTFVSHRTRPHALQVGVFDLQHFARLDLSVLGGVPVRPGCRFFTPAWFHIMDPAERVHTLCESERTLCEDVE